MPKHIDIMRMREEEIFSLLEFISQKTQGFSDPKLITIGGYALRAYIPFSRYTRDCDFVMRKEVDWGIDTLKTLLSKKINIETIVSTRRFKCIMKSFADSRLYIPFHLYYNHSYDLYHMIVS